MVVARGGFPIHLKLDFKLAILKANILDRVENVYDFLRGFHDLLDPPGMIRLRKASAYVEPLQCRTSTQATCSD